ncbi:hypothetical protein Nocox_20850 [Nonomuraea coxensis DSM 45129]|uniref:PAC domain-containing protein n=2 Tax=Nonomuraea coxensis TaxID=404386 RepID=A0ABX8U289_9ACTN|nr:hypothetical protein Nocox_20850 [Nonomuraea coxensis DSM 45129]
MTGKPAASSAREVDSFLRGDGYVIPVTWFSDPVTRDGEVAGMTVLFTGDASDRDAADGLAAHVTALEDLTDRLHPYASRRVISRRDGRLRHRLFPDGPPWR